MKKRIVCLILALCMTASVLCLNVFAATALQNQSANALKSLGLFLGTGKSFALDEQLTRDQGITMLVRMLGKEKTAMEGTFQHPFTDMTEWAEAYVSYAYANKLTKGVSATKFSGKSAMSKQMFVTITLRALGYSDSADGDFEYKNAIAFAKQVGLTASADNSEKYLRGQAVEVFWAALNTKLNGENRTLAEKLIGDGVFTKKDFEKAVEIQKTKVEDDHAATVDLNPDLQKHNNDKKPTPTNKMTWDEYQALSTADKKAFIKTFPSTKAFNEWSAQAQENAKNDAVIIENGTVIQFN